MYLVVLYNVLGGYQNQRSQIEVKADSVRRTKVGGALCTSARCRPRRKSRGAHTGKKLTRKAGGGDTSR
jgi:hypothetical protein